MTPEPTPEPTPGPSTGPITGPGQPPPARVRVTNPLTTASARQDRSVRQEIDEDTGIGEVYVRSLVSSQLRAAISVVITVLLTIGALPLALVLLPGLRDVRVWSVPVTWPLLGALVYPGIWLLAWLYERQSSSTEADFVALVDVDPAADRRAG